MRHWARRARIAPYTLRNTNVTTEACQSFAEQVALVGTASAAIGYIIGRIVSAIAG